MNEMIQDATGATDILQKIEDLKLWVTILLVVCVLNVIMTLVIGFSNKK